MKNIIWMATINGSDNPENEIIKIGVEKLKSGFVLVAENGEDISVGVEESFEIATESIKLQWGAWDTFEWIN